MVEVPAIILYGSTVAMNASDDTVHDDGKEEKRGKRNGDGVPFLIQLFGVGKVEGQATRMVSETVFNPFFLSPCLVFVNLSRDFFLVSSLL